MKYYAKDSSFRNKVISENGTFLLWIPDSFYFKHLIFVDDELPGMNENILKHFSSVKLIDSCSNVYSRQYGIKIFFLQNATDTAWLISPKDTREAKKKFNR